MIHPYMPNSVDTVKKEMMDEIGVKSISDIYESVIPKELRLDRPLKLPEPILSEQELKKHVETLLEKNISCADYSNFLGAGCYQRYVPAICDEIAGRAEFLTAYCGDTYSDHGKMQAIFEYASMMAELLDTDVVSYTMFDAGQAVSSSMRMAFRLRKNRKTILVPHTMNPEIYSQATHYCKSDGRLVKVKAESGLMDMKDYARKLTDDVAAVFIENPTFLGAFEKNAKEIIDLAHKKGALAIVMPSVTSLGIIEPPANYGADITCGDIQELGIHMNYGGGLGGFIATAMDDELVEEYPTYLYGIAETEEEGKFGWGRALNHRCSHGSRENAKEYFGTEAGLWTIVAGTYLALMGPQGMKETAELIQSRAVYAEAMLKKIGGIEVNAWKNQYFQEFTVCFDKAKMTVKEVNQKLLEYGIFGGKDLSGWFPEYGQSALYCFGEMTDQKRIDQLCMALKNIVEGE
ncbi:MAG: aminomethyl-transferring glycine dehydrogenase subunit GcvPA [Coprococcus sp.]|nr:aminomethyl-transferring glycine dehydrogenase subunit GcvPA [Coprococcus sp.]